MVTKKQIWDTLDELEGKKKGSSYRALKKELKRQGYGYKKTKKMIKNKMKKSQKFALSGVCVVCRKCGSADTCSDEYGNTKCNSCNNYMKARSNVVIDKIDK